MKTIGIIGGMGPLAAADLFQKIIKLTNASCDAQHVHVYIDSNTNIPDRTQAILYGGQSPAPEIIQSAKKLESIGADVLVIACNTSHYYYPEIAASVSVPIINILEECANEAAKLKYSSVGLLATEAVAKTKLYENTFQKHGVPMVVPNAQQQKIVTSLIYDCIKAGNDSYDIAPFLEVLQDLRAQGAQAFLLGCTELPIAFKQFKIEGNTIDPTTILAKSAILAAGASIKENS